MSREPFRTLVSRTVVIAQENVDTDQIIPARFLTTTAREGLGRLAFHDWRYDGEGRLTDSLLNAVNTRTHQVLVAGRNFGCGSSREHAPWALLDFGVRAVVSTEIADIFTSNSLKNGLLPVVVDVDTHARLMEPPGEEVSVDLEAGELRFGNHVAPFTIEAFARRCLLDGVDPLGFILDRRDAIDAFEQSRAA